MKRKMNLFLLLLPPFLVQAQLPDATAIMNETRELTLAGSLSATITLNITEKNGSSRNRAISISSRSFADGTEKRLIRFLEPADVRGTSMLVYDYRNSSDEMWIFLPALKKTRRIVSSEKGKSFMSSEFSNADMSSPATGDFVSKHLAESGLNNIWIIESAAVSEDKADEYGYSRKISYVSIDKKVVKKMEFYNFDNELFKVIEIKSVYPGEGGKYLVSQMSARNLVNGRSSEIKFSGIKLNASIDEALFNIQMLEK